MVQRILIFLTLWFSHPLFSQGGWQHSVAVTGSTYNSCYNALEDPTTGNIVLAGRSKTGTVGVVCLIGLDSNGTKLWQKFYGDSINSLFPYYGQFSIARCADSSGFFVTVPIQKPGGIFLPTVIKYNWQGDSIDYHEYYDAGQGEIMVIMDMCKSKDGGYFLTGFVDGVNGMKCVLLKTDNNGNKLWIKKYTQLYSNIMSSCYVMQDALSKRLVITGVTEIYGTNNSLVHRGLLLITDSLGNEIARPTFGSPGVAKYYSVSQFSDGSLVACGTYSTYVTENNNTYQKYFGYICNFDLDGKLIWERKYEELGTISTFAFCSIDKFDRIWVQGGSNGFGLKTNSLMLMNFDRQGEFGSVKSYKTHTDSLGEFNYSVIKTRRNGWLLSSYYAVNQNAPFGVVKTDSNGCALSEAQCTSIYLGTAAQNKVQMRLYPNPTTGHLYLGEEGNAVPVQVSVFEISGRLVRSFKPTALKVDLSDLENGIYMVQLTTTSNVVSTHKIIISR